MMAWQGVSITGAPHIVCCKNTSVDRLREKGGDDRVKGGRGG